MIHKEILSIVRATVSHEKLLILLFSGIFGLIFLTLPVFLALALAFAFAFAFALAVVVWFLRRTSSVWGVTFGLVCGL